jgi:hypothetical protein
MINSILEWILPAISGGGIGAGITWLCTFRSKRKQANAEADKA